MLPVLYIVVPCYNEEQVINETAKRLLEKLMLMNKDGICDPSSRILFVDDGSKDGTWGIIEYLSSHCEYFSALKLAHNRGHQNALYAGLVTAAKYADCVVSMDADLQDDISVLDEFVEKFISGYDIVYGVRSDRTKDSFFKRHSAQFFYKLMHMLGAEVVYNHADYRLMSRRAIEALEQYNEANLFLRGIVPDIGFDSSIVEYERHERFAGKSKYPFKKMVSFALDGITSFSVKPLKLISNVGILISVLSVLGLLYALISKFTGSAEPGWTAIIASIWLIGGIQLLCLGIIGEYIGKIYSETKNRPKFIVEKFIHK